SRVPRIFGPSEQLRCCAIHDPQQAAVQWTNPLSRVTRVSRWLKNVAQDLRLALAGNQKRDFHGVIEQRVSKCDAIGMKLVNPIRNYQARGLIQRGAFREQGGGVAIVTEPEEDEIEARPGAARQSKESAQLILILLPGYLGIKLCGHAEDVRGRN